MPQTQVPQPKKKSGLFGKVMAALLLLIFVVVIVLVVMAWQALSHPGTSSGSVSEPNNGEVEIWQPNGATTSGSQVFTPPSTTQPPAAASEAQTLPPAAGGTAPKPAPRTPAEEGTPIQPVAPNEVPIQPVNPRQGESEIKPVNPPPTQQAPRQTPRQPSGGGNPANPVDNLF